MKRKFQEKDREVQKLDANVQKYTKKQEANEKKLEEREGIILEKNKEITNLKETIEKNDRSFHATVSLSGKLMNIFN